MTCRLFHDWGKWEDTTFPKLVTSLGVTLEEREVHGQQKTCKRCGKKVYRKF